MFEKNYDLQIASALQIRGNVIHSNPSGYVMTCIKRDTNNLSVFRGIALIKSDPNGNILWTKTYNDSSYFGGEPFVCQTSDNGYIISSSTRDTSIAYLIKTDPLGNLQWSRTYGDTSSISYIYSYSTGCVSTSNDIFLAGISGPDYLLVKTDYFGNTIWMKSYDSGIGWDYLEYTIKTSDGGILMSGFSKDSVTNDFSIFLVKVDLNGNLIWSNKYVTGKSGTEPRFSSEDSNGDILITGRTYDYGAGEWDIFLAKFSSTGNFIYGKTWGGLDPDEGYSVFQTQDGGNIICSEPESFHGTSQATLIKTNSLGNSIWMKAYGKPTGLYPFGGLLNSDKGYTIFGIDGNYFEVASLYLIRTDSLGLSTCEPQIVTLSQGSFKLIATPTIATGSLNNSNTFSVTQKNLTLTSNNVCDNIDALNELTNESSLEFFPNPFCSFTTIKLSKDFQKASLKLYNALGQIEKDLVLSPRQRNRINRDNLSAGIYYATICSDNKLIITTKLVITN